MKHIQFAYLSYSARNRLIMKVLNKKCPSFKKENLEIQAPISNLPFMFSVCVPPDACDSTSASDRKKPKDPKAKLEESSFSKELSKIGLSAKLIPDKNPSKVEESCKEDIGSLNKSCLPFQRRTRSSSPFREAIKLNEKLKELFCPRSPVMASHKMKLLEDFAGFCKDSGNYSFEEDEDLKNLKEAYFRQLENSKNFNNEDDSDEVEDEGEVEKFESRVDFVKNNIYFKD